MRPWRGRARKFIFPLVLIAEPVTISCKVQFVSQLEAIVATSLYNWRIIEVCRQITRTFRTAWAARKTWQTRQFVRSRRGYPAATRLEEVLRVSNRGTWISRVARCMLYDSVLTSVREKVSSSVEILMLDESYTLVFANRNPHITVSGANLVSSPSHSVLLRHTRCIFSYANALWNYVKAICPLNGLKPDGIIISCRTLATSSLRAVDTLSGRRIVKLRTHQCTIYKQPT